MLYWNIVKLEYAKINHKILVPSFLCELEYNSNVELVELIARTYRQYVDIRYISIEGYKHVLVCSYVNNDDMIEYDLLGVNVVAYE